MKNVKYSLRGQSMAMELCPIKLKRGLFKQNRSRKWWSFKRRAPKVKRCQRFTRDAVESGMMSFWSKKSQMQKTADAKNGFLRYDGEGQGSTQDWSQTKKRIAKMVSA